MLNLGLELITPIVVNSTAPRGISRNGCGWKAPLEVSWSKQGRPEMVAQDHVQMAFDYLQAWTLHNLCGQPVPVLRHPHSKNCFLTFRGKLLCFSLCLLPLVLSLSTTVNPYILP